MPKRLRQADGDTSIQGYTDGVFWERNTLGAQKQKSAKNTQDITDGAVLF